jgi:hypothetical protein
MKRFLGSLLFLFLAGNALGQTHFSRAGLREYSLQPHLFGSRSYEFEGGARARVDGGYGIGLGFAHHFSDHLALGVDFTLAAVDYRATVVPGAGNAGAAFDQSATLERGTVRVNATWHLLASRSTPFVTANLGAVYLDPGVLEPPAVACWSYPWWGAFCGAQSPSHGMTRLTYGAGAGWRWDLAGNRGFVRLLASAERIDWPGPPGSLDNVEVRADFGAPF